MEYDCATGRITEPLIAGSDGRFVAAGTHTPGHGGPIRPDEVLPSRPARYDGRVDGDLMSLTVVMTDSQRDRGHLSADARSLAKSIQVPLNEVQLKVCCIASVAEAELALGHGADTSNSETRHCGRWAHAHT